MKPATVLFVWVLVLAFCLGCWALLYAVLVAVHQFLP